MPLFLFIALLVSPILINGELIPVDRFGTKMTNPLNFLVHGDGGVQMTGVYIVCYS